MTQLEALGLTLLIEGSLAALAAAVRLVPARAVIAALAASLLTHPLAWTASLTLGEIPFAVRATGIEAAVVVAEAAVLRATAPPISWPRAAAVALSLNAASFAVGRAVAGV